jgi:carbon storage regulator
MPGLVLTRRVGESVFIGRKIKVTVISAAGGQAKIRFDAPEEVEIHREEVLNRILGVEEDGDFAKDEHQNHD